MPFAVTLLEKAIVADDRVSYTGTVTSVAYGHDQAGAAVVHIDHRAPRSWRFWYMAPADAYGRMIVSNESLTYQYEPKTGKVYRNDWSESVPDVIEALNVEQVEKNYSFDVGPGATVAGRPVLTLSFMSKYTGNLVERLWIDRQTMIPLRSEGYHADGTIATKSSFDSVRFVRDLPKDLFELTVPRGMVLVNAERYGDPVSDLENLASGVNFKIASPVRLPYGFALQKASTQTHKGVHSVQLLYSDGLRNFSLFENPTAQLPNFGRASSRHIQVGGSSGEAAYVGGQAIISWNASGLNLTMVGDLTPKELANIGASIRL